MFDLPSLVARARLEWGNLEPLLQAVWLPDGDGGDYEFVVGPAVGDMEDLGLTLEDFDVLDEQGNLVEKGLRCRIIGNVITAPRRSPSVESREMEEIQDAMMESRALVVDRQEAFQMAGAGSSSRALGFAQAPVSFPSVEEVFGELFGLVCL